MQVHNIVRKNTYYDSVTLMLISKQLRQLGKLDDVSVMMGTPANRTILREANLLSAEGSLAGSNDLIIAFRTNSGVDAQWISGEVDKLLNKKVANTAKSEVQAVRTSDKAYKDSPDSNLALISVPGEYAAIETLKALRRGKNVFLFSDNVSLEQEAFLKKTASDQGLIVMGPDCGTSILNGVGIGFANRVKRGSVGLVAASGTGLQEVVCLLDAMGLGISHAIGTGGRDLKEEVGAITMLQGIDLLTHNPETETIVLISKPPAKTVADKILARLAASGKKTVVCFIGFTIEQPPVGISVTSTLEGAALEVARVNGFHPDLLTPQEHFCDWVAQARSRLSPTQKYVRALYAGGTLCYEAMLTMSAHLGPIYSNIALDNKYSIDDFWSEDGHSAVDLGDDAFTRGRPHPMIDGSLRNELIEKIAVNKGTAVLLLDVVIGFGASKDPVGELLPVIKSAHAKAKSVGSELVTVAYVCGSDQDEQCKPEQVARLRSAGVLVARTNAEASRMACAIAGGLGGEKLGDN